MQGNNVWQKSVLCDLIALVFLKNKRSYVIKQCQSLNLFSVRLLKIKSHSQWEEPTSPNIAEYVYTDKGPQALIILYSNKEKIFYMVLTSNQTETQALW